MLPDEEGERCSANPLPSTPAPPSPGRGMSLLLLLLLLPPPPLLLSRAPSTTFCFWCHSESSSIDDCALNPSTATVGPAPQLPPLQLSSPLPPEDTITSRRASDRDRRASTSTPRIPLPDDNVMVGVDSEAVPSTLVVGLLLLMMGAVAGIVVLCNGDLAFG